jgi:hypothetical protein
MASIEKVIEEWKEDSKIDELRLVSELIRTPSLHAKYLEYFMFFKAKLAVTETKYYKLKFQKRKYYRGEMTQAELQQYGWQQFQGLKMSMTEFNSMADMDPDLVGLAELMINYKSSIQAVEYVMKQIHSRDYSLKAIVDYQKFLAGN